MKRTVTLAIVGALILGLIIPSVILAQGNPGQGQSPQLSPHDQTVLHIIAENQALAVLITPVIPYGNGNIVSDAFRS